MAPDSRLLQTDIGISGPDPTPPSQQGLPEDLLREAAQRLGYTCLISGGLCLANWLVVRSIHPLPGTYRAEEMALHAQWVQVFDWVVGVGFLASIGLFWYTRKSRRSARFLLDLALVYEVSIALGIGILNYAVGHPEGVLDWAYAPPNGMSWIAIIILLFAAFIPSTPRKTLATALLAASMDPIAAQIWKAAGQEIPSIGQVLIIAIPNYLCAAVAPLISRVIIGLGREVRKAREMGSYVLGSRIGAGGMGEVWQATHRFLVRPAAIKLIKPDVLGAMTKEQGDVLVQRFRREARAAANLRSPHTIQLYDFGVASDGTFYYVMELLNGMDLQTLVTRHGPLPPARAIFLLQQACESLAEAHDRGLIHRDIKPANIQVCRMGHYFDYVKVLDFGLVKSQAAVANLGLTTPNAVTGTPAYLSPEIALGETVDQRTDIYALGCVAYWMLTGRQVFTGDSAMQIVARHVSSEPARPSRHSAFDVSPGLDELVLACLKKKPSERPSTARELCDLLGRCEVEATWTREDARLWWETRLEPEAAVSLVD